MKKPRQGPTILKKVVCNYFRPLFSWFLNIFSNEFWCFRRFRKWSTFTLKTENVLIFCVRMLQKLAKNDKSSSKSEVVGEQMSDPGTSTPRECSRQPEMQRKHFWITIYLYLIEVNYLGVLRWICLKRILCIHQAGVPSNDSSIEWGDISFSASIGVNIYRIFTIFEAFCGLIQRLQNDSKIMKIQ